MGQFVQIYVTSNISEVIHRRSVDYLESKLNLVQTYLKQNIMWTSQTMVNRNISLKLLPNLVFDRSTDVAQQLFGLAYTSLLRRELMECKPCKD